MTIYELTPLLSSARTGPVADCGYLPLPPPKWQAKKNPSIPFLLIFQGARPLYLMENCFGIPNLTQTLPENPPGTLLRVFQRPSRLSLGNVPQISWKLAASIPESLLRTHRDTSRGIA